MMVDLSSEVRCNGLGNLLDCTSSTGQAVSSHVYGAVRPWSDKSDPKAREAEHTFADNPSDSISSNDFQFLAPQLLPQLLIRVSKLMYRVSIVSCAQRKLACACLLFAACPT